MASKGNGIKVQVSDHREGVLHVQVGVPGSYARIDLPRPETYSLKGLKKNTSLYGSDTEYRVIPPAAFSAKGEFRAKHGFSIGGQIEKAYKEAVKAAQAQ